MSAPQERGPLGNFFWSSSTSLLSCGFPALRMAQWKISQIIGTSVRPFYSVTAGFWFNFCYAQRLLGVTGGSDLSVVLSKIEGEACFRG
jgi:hypothetical protein